jgi:hypothetical protein
MSATHSSDLLNALKSSTMVVLRASGTETTFLKYA